MIQRAMNALALSAAVILCLGLPSCSTVPESQATKDEKRIDMRNMANDTLQQLYAQNPDTQKAVKQSAGYAVFSDVGFKLLFLGGANGAGVAINNAVSKGVTMYQVTEKGLIVGESITGAKFYKDSDLN